MKSVTKLFPCLIFIIIAISWLFYFEHDAIDNSVKYKPLANGWISIYPPIHLDDSLNFEEKIKATIYEDLVNGRFRPAFFFYSTIGYAVSPIFHGRVQTGEKRKFRDLMTGDLQLYGFLLLSSVALASVLMCLLINSYIGTLPIILIALFFIPLSSSLTENLLQNYIDSQEIPLVLWLTLWLFFLFKSLNYKQGHLPGKYIYWGLSILFMTLAFLTKETMIVSTCSLMILIFFIFQKRYHDDVDNLVQRKVFVGISFFLSIVYSCGVIAVVTANKHGYATAYQSGSIAGLLIAVKSLWSCASRFSLHNVYGFLPIILSYFVLYVQRGKTINGHPVSRHLALSLVLLSLSYGFLFILIPWKPILVKYVFPSVFFFNFLVVYSLGIIFSWLKSSDIKILKYISYCIIVPYIFLFWQINPRAAFDRKFLFHEANFGVDALHLIAENIDAEFPKDQQDLKVFVGFEMVKAWSHHIQWTTLHLQRILNLEKDYNILEREGNIIKNIAMPEGELTSFKPTTRKRNLFLSDAQDDLGKIKFDIVYRGFLTKENIPDVVKHGPFKYVNTRQIFEFPKKYNLPAYRIVKYIADGAEIYTNR